MENGSSHNNTMPIPSILVDLFSLQIVFGLIYYISSFLLNYCSLFHSYFGLFGIFKVKNEAKKTNVVDEYLMSSNRESLFDDGGDCLFGRDIQMVMGKLGVKGSLGGEGEVQKRWGCYEMCGIFEEEPSLEEVKEAFSVFDENEDGFIDAKELQRVLCVLGLRHGKELKACSMMIREFDENNDGKIDFNEFVRLMLKSF